jgi:hypothetical protein
MGNKKYSDFHVLGILTPKKHGLSEKNSFRAVADCFYLPHMEYEGSIG